MENAINAARAEFAHNENFDFLANLSNERIEQEYELAKTVDYAVTANDENINAFARLSRIGMKGRANRAEKQRLYLVANEIHKQVIANARANNKRLASNFKARTAYYEDLCIKNADNEA